MKRHCLPALLAPLLLATAACVAQPLMPSAFGWRAPLELPAGASVARASLPADATLHLQSRDARDLRVFNAAGQPVPFAFMPTPPAAADAASTRSYRALPLLSAPLASGRPRGSVQVRLDDGGRQRSVWVQLDGVTAAGDTGPRAALRSEAGQPWRPLANTVIYRLGSGTGEGTNPPAALHGASARWLRIESSSGVELGAEQITVEAVFEPVQLAFVATGNSPFALALGRAGTQPAAVPLAVIASALGQRKLQELPQASVGVAQRHDPHLESVFGWLAPGKPTVLWAVLVAGVLILAAVAWSLLRQLKMDAPKV